MKTNAKKLILAAVLFLLAVMAWQSIFGDNMHLNIDGDEIDGPLGAVLAVFFGGAGLLIGGVVTLCVAVFLCLLFAGLGVLMVGGMALAAVIVAAAVSPLLLPLLIPIGIYWFFSARSRKQRHRLTMEQAV